MATFDTTRPFASGNLFTGNMVHVIATARAKVLDWNDRRQTRKMLLSLTDRELTDIGLSRGDIDRAI